MLPVVPWSMARMSFAATVAPSWAVRPAPFYYPWGVNGSSAPGRLGVVGVVVGVAFVGVVLLWFFDPSQGGFFPPCPLFKVTGLQCPGCGTTRALHALVHGDVAAAVRWNPFTMGLVPLVLLKAVTPPLPRWALAPLAVLFFSCGVGFGVWRNL